jgi:inosine-uridine nucleoside N-ribohydrolase
VGVGDDAYALLLALRSPTLQVIGITTVAGNVDVDQVWMLSRLRQLASATPVRWQRSFNRMG